MAHCQVCCQVEPSTPEMYLTCDTCNMKVHLQCLKSGPQLPTPLQGDTFFTLTCAQCSTDHEEIIRRGKIPWVGLLLLVIYNLHCRSDGISRHGYFHWKIHICEFIEKYWNLLLGVMKKKKKTWYGTVSGTLSHYSSQLFISGLHELGEQGWWKLACVAPPAVLLSQVQHAPKSLSNRRSPMDRGTLPPPSAEVMECRRPRRNVMSTMEAAIALKERRSTLTEAKDIRRAQAMERASVSEPKAKHLKIKSHAFPEVTRQKCDITFLSCNPVAETSVSLTSPTQQSSVSSSICGSSYETPNKPTVGVSNETVVIKDEPLDSQEIDLQTDFEQSKHFLSEKQSSEVNAWSTLNVLMGTNREEMNKGLGKGLKANAASLGEFSTKYQNAANYAAGTIHNQQTTVSQSLFPSDKSDSDSELDVGADNTDINDMPSLNQCQMPNVEDLLSQLSGPIVGPGNDSQWWTGPKREQVKVEPEDENMSGSGWGQEDESESEEEEIQARGKLEKLSNSEGTFQPNRRCRNKDGDEIKEETTVKGPVCMPMNVYEEKQLLKQLEGTPDAVASCPEAWRLRRKLLVRQAKRERNLPVFNYDALVSQLSGHEAGSESTGDSNSRSGCEAIGEVRVLDRFQYSGLYVQSQHQSGPTLRLRLVGQEDSQGESFVSPYTGRFLKPYIRRDFETTPLKLKLLQEIVAYHYLHEPLWKPPVRHPIDYCYVQPQHIPSVNTLCQEFFWPGIDLSECLQYPDFSCVVLYRRVVIGFAFMVPDVSYNEAYISFIFTHPEWRRAGIATFMLYHLIQTCMGKDVTLHVSATNSALILYQKFGFKVEEYILDFYDKYLPADSKECKHALFLRLSR